MDYSSNKKRANKILYISVVSVLCILAVLITITSANNRKKEENLKKSETTQSVKQEETTKSSLPQMGTPKRDEDTTPSKDNVHNAVAETEKAEESAKADDAEDASAETEDDAEAVGNTPEEEMLPVFTAPVSGAVAKEYTDSILVYSLTMNDYRTHTGIDYSAEIGSPVYAVADGTINEIWEDPMMGTCMSVIHTGGAVSIYKNLSKDSYLIDGIEPGAVVKAEQVIASIGETAMIEQSDEPHLHYELKIKDQFVNPSDYIQVSNELAYEG